MASTPYASLLPTPSRATERLVYMAPTLLRRRTSRRARSTLKLVARAPAVSASPDWMLRAPRVNAPARPVSRPPARSGTSCATEPPLRPIRRL